MASKRHSWYTGLVLTTCSRSGDLIIAFLKANMLYMPNFQVPIAYPWPRGGTCGTLTWSPTTDLSEILARRAGHALS